MRISALLLFGIALIASPFDPARADRLPVFDAHVHYSHDSVEMTPPARVIELMREAGLRRALVSSSDDNGTQLLVALAPDLVIPGLRPYRRRGETGSWIRDPQALNYVEKLLETNRYASLGEFHLFGEDADLPIAKRIVELAASHNLVLHAHADADAVRRLFAHNASIKVLWAHGGFDTPAQIDAMLSAYPGLWADLAFRTDMVLGEQVDERFVRLFEKFPNRLMVGTDTFTPERIYYIPEHASFTRKWLAMLPAPLAEKIAWRNAEALFAPVWDKNRVTKPTGNNPGRAQMPLSPALCEGTDNTGQGRKNAATRLRSASGDAYPAWVSTPPLAVSQLFAAELVICSPSARVVAVDAVMPAHGHGTNYRPSISESAADAMHRHYRADGMLLHMPGQWQWQITLQDNGQTHLLTGDFTVQ